MKYYIDNQGRYLGGWDANPPVGAVEVPEPPQDARQVWGGQTWQNPTVTPEAIAARRYEAEVGGITLNGLQINTDDRSKLLINGAASRATRNPSYVLNWKTPAGYIQIPAEQVLAIGDAVADHVQSCFDREAEIITELENGTLTDAMLEQGWPT